MSCGHLAVVLGDLPAPADPLRETGADRVRLVRGCCRRSSRPCIQSLIFWGSSTSAKMRPIGASISSLCRTTTGASYPHIPHERVPVRDALDAARTLRWTILRREVSCSSRRSTSSSSRPPTRLSRPRRARASSRAPRRAREPTRPAVSGRVRTGRRRHGVFWGAEASSGRRPASRRLQSAMRAVTRPTRATRGLLGANRPHRGRARRLRPGADKLRGDAPGLLGEPRSHPGHAPGERRRHAVPLGDLLDERGPA